MTGPSDPGGAKSKTPVHPVDWESTATLVERARTGDRDAAHSLLERASPVLRRWTSGRIPPYGRGHADTEDVVQDAIVQTLRRIDSFDYRSVGALQAFLREVVMNRIRDVLRLVRRRGPAEELPEHLVVPDASPLERAILAQRTERFMTALQQLRPADRQAVVWRIELGYSYKEVAQLLGSTDSAARMRVSRAIAKLAAQMQVSIPQD